MSEYDFESESSSSSERSMDFSFEYEEERDCTNASGETDDIEFERLGLVYMDEPVATEENAAKYQEEKSRKAERLKELKKRLEGQIKLEEWCKCGNCSLSFLSNEKECLCCHEIDGCKESFQSEEVVRDIGDEDFVCVTNHPGFEPVCLKKWSLRLAADKYKTRDRKKYCQIGEEERFLRSVSYREFTRLIHGRIGNRRIPLPACAYHLIRGTFQVNDTATGFVDEVEILE